MWFEREDDAPAPMVSVSGDTWTLVNAPSVMRAVEENRDAGDGDELGEGDGEEDPEDMRLEKANARGMPAALPRRGFRSAVVEAV